MTLKTLDTIFRKKIMAELAVNAPVYSFLPSIINNHIKKNLNQFALRKEKNGHFVVPSPEINLVFG